MIWDDICKVSRGEFCNYDSDITGFNVGGEDTNYTNFFKDKPNYEGPVFREGNGGGNTLYRLREGIERFLITDVNNPAGAAQAQSTIAVMHDIVADTLDSRGKVKNRAVTFNHVPGGSNVLFMDGHVEFIKYPGKYPITHYAAMLSAGGDLNYSLPVVDADFFLKYSTMP